MTTSPTTATVITTMGNSIIRLAECMAHAHEVQYLPPAAPSARGETSERSRGGISRPTEDTATNERRLRLRAAMATAELNAARIAAQADADSEALTAALQAWAGQRA